MTTVITGSASGMGAALYARLKKAGENVIGLDVKGGDVVADLATKEGREAAIAGVKKKCGNSLDGLALVAGISTLSKPPSRVVSVNYFGVIDLLDGLFELLKRGTNPSAVAVASMGMVLAPAEHPAIKAMLDHDEAEAGSLVDALRPDNASLLAYVMAKFAVVEAVRKRALEWGRAGVRINAVAPGNINTPMLAEYDQATLLKMNPAAIGPEPYGRFGEPEELAPVIAFLLGPEASYVHGTCWWADGGTDAILFRRNGNWLTHRSSK